MPNRYIAVLLSGLLLIGLSACSTTLKHPEAASTARDECVVLLHGLWRNNLAMWPLEEALLAQGYTVVNLDYPSTSMPIPDLAEQYLAPAVEQCDDAVDGPTHLVSHSMGGILVRWYLQTEALHSEARVVMLSPPNQGNELAIHFRDWPLFDLFVGQAARQLSTDELGILGQLQPLRSPTGIIGGQRTRGWFSLGLLPEPNDGTVSVDSMRLPEMRDFLLVDESHVSIRGSALVHEQVIHFLSKGQFKPG
ncbi:esterase/lipase family protein [Allohahella marinimesophila]|uniref:Alpha/beta fold hydrolase n=1 Tax=Allohahella marinimesophila TaxID=1054972 RepID=A0ABP7NHC8_9GAMM